MTWRVMPAMSEGSADGVEELHTLEDFENYGTISGFTALRPGKFTFAKRLRVKMHNGVETAERVAAMTEPDKQKAVKILSYTHNESQRICQEAEETRRFFTPANIATVNGWSEQIGSPVRIHFVLEADSFCVARDSSEHHTPIAWPENFWRNIQQLEPLNRDKAA